MTTPNRNRANQARKPRTDKGSRRSHCVRNASMPDDGEAEIEHASPAKQVTLPALACLQKKLIGGELI